VTADLPALLAAATPGPWRTSTDWSEYDGLESGEANWIMPHGAYSSVAADNELMALAPLLAQACLDAETALNGMVWLDNNRHNYGDPMWLDFFDAAMIDVHSALVSLRAATGNSE
jgi:hypothetical protein